MAAVQLLCQETQLQGNMEMSGQSVRESFANLGIWGKYQLAVESEIINL